MVEVFENGALPAACVQVRVRRAVTSSKAFATLLEAYTNSKDIIMETGAKLEGWLDELREAAQPDSEMTALERCTQLKDVVCGYMAAKDKLPGNAVVKQLDEEIFDALKHFDSVFDTAPTPYLNGENIKAVANVFHEVLSDVAIGYSDNITVDGYKTKMANTLRALNSQDIMIELLASLQFTEAMDDVIITSEVFKADLAKFKKACGAAKTIDFSETNSARLQTAWDSLREFVLGYDDQVLLYKDDMIAVLSAMSDANETLVAANNTARAKLQNCLEEWLELMVAVKSLPADLLEIDCKNGWVTSKALQTKLVKLKSAQLAVPISSEFEGFGAQMRAIIDEAEAALETSWASRFTTDQEAYKTSIDALDEWSKGTGTAERWDKKIKKGTSLTEVAKIAQDTLLKNVNPVALKKNIDAIGDLKASYMASAKLVKDAGLPEDFEANHNKIVTAAAAAKLNAIALAVLADGKVSETAKDTLIAEVKWARKFGVNEEDAMPKSLFAKVSRVMGK